MRPFVKADEIQGLDLRTMAALNLDSFGLMQKVAREMADHFKTNHHLLEGDVLVLAGPGNNGGDGYCLAEYLRQRGRKVAVFEVHEPRSEEAREARKFFQGELVSDFRKSSIVVDAIYGASGRSDLADAEVRILKEVNRRPCFRVTIDVPTGVDAREASVHEHAFMADLSLVVGWPKEAFLSENVAETLGRVQFIGEYFSQPQQAQTFAIEKKDFSLPKRKRTGFKNIYGRVGIVGGSSEMPGAAILAAEAAHRFGAGYATVYFAKSGSLKIRVKDASFILRTKWAQKDLQKETALVLGCGGFFKKFSWSQVKLPAVIDADALYDLKKLKTLKGPAVLTPHIGEAARLLGETTRVIKQNRFEALSRLCEGSMQSVYLKGAPGLLRLAGSNINYVNLSMNSVFSKAGSGDVLAGLLGSSLAQSFSTHSGDGVSSGGNSNSSQMPETMKVFRSAVVSALVFQAELGEVLRDCEATISSDQLEVFSETFNRLRT